jgi:transcriptional regulator with XRE-family HTH domain
MTHVQELFIKNLRFLRKKHEISQVAFSEMINLSPNYLNAVENGKNFPSPEVIQKIADNLNVLPYELFLESPVDKKSQDEAETMVQNLVKIKQYLVQEIDKIIVKYT